MSSNPPILTPLEALQELLDATSVNLEETTDPYVHRRKWEAQESARLTLYTYSWNADTIRSARNAAGYSQPQLTQEGIRTP